MKTALLTMIAALTITQTAMAETFCAVGLKQADGSYVSDIKTTKKLEINEGLHLVYQADGLNYFTAVSDNGKQLNMIVMDQGGKTLNQVAASDASQLKMLLMIVPANDTNFLCFQGSQN